MSRIVGLIQKSRGIGDDNLLKTSLLAAKKGCIESQPWRSDITKIDRLCFGWVGWQQEFKVQKESYFLMLDGYIYNDYEFIKKNDSNLKLEFLLELYYQFGFAGMLQRLNGDFVIALYDKSNNELFIGRDRFGIKPLYYFQNSNLFAFASRCSSLLTLGAPTEVDPAFVGRFAGTHYRYIDNKPERSPYLHINQLPAAHYLCVKTQKSSDTSQLVIPKRWWDIKDQEDLVFDNEIDLAGNYRDLLLDAVKIRLAKTKNPAFTLSGGMDSSSVLASAVYNTGQKFHAFSTTYKDKTYDESSEIKSMLEGNTQEWHPIYIDEPDVFKLVNNMIAQHDEPVATATWLSHFLLCKVVADNGYSGLFGGLGGDELNAGEYEYFFYHFADLKKNNSLSQYQHEVHKWCEYHDHPIFKKNLGVAEDALKKLVDSSMSGHCLPDKSRMFRYAHALNSEFFNEQFKPNMEHRFSSYLKNRTYQDLYYETAPCCLRAEDRQTIGHSLDNFLPFFDYRLVQFMFKVPGTLKIRDGITKVLLREAMRGILPEETRIRIKKTGWNAPAHQWFSGKGLENIRDLISSNQFRNRGIYNHTRLEEVLDQHQTIVSNGNIKENHMMFLWQVVNLELWLRSIEN